MKDFVGKNVKVTVAFGFNAVTAAVPKEFEGVLTGYRYGVPFIKLDDDTYIAIKFIISIILA